MQSGLMRVRSFAPMTRRQFGRGAAALGALAAFGAGRSARAAAEVTFLGWQGYDAALVTEDFLAKNDIKLNTTYIGNNDEIVTKLTTSSGQIDIVTPYMGYIPVLAAAELIEPIDESLVPNLADVLPLFRNDKNLNVDGKLYGVPFTWGSAPMLYDPAVTPAPESWRDLEKPEFKGKVGMMDDPIGNIMLAAIIATDAEIPTLLTPEQLKAAVDYLIKLKTEQVRVVSVSWGEMGDALARGDIAVTFSGWETIKLFVKRAGKDVEYTYPKEGTFAWLDNYCIAKDAPNREVDHAVANHIISVPAQLHIAKELMQGIVNAKAIAQLDPDSRAIYPYDSIEDFGKKAGFYAFPPTEPDGTHATWEQFQAEYERFKAA